LEPWEKEAIIGFHLKNPLEGYRRLTFMMLDADVVAVSPASVWRVLKQAGLLSRWKSKPSRKGTGFEQPLQSHQHWHIDVSYIPVRHLLLLVQHSGWIQPFPRALGSA
jgi:putative transposase